MLPETFNYSYSFTVRQQFEILRPSLREKAKRLYPQYILNSELALHSGYCCVRGIYVCMTIHSGGTSWGTRGTW